MCHHHEIRELAALREELEASEPTDDEEPVDDLVTAEPEEPRQRLPPIQPSD